MTETKVITLNESLYPNCPKVPIEDTSLEAVLDHHEKLVPTYDNCRSDVIRALDYLEQKKAELEKD